jgi:hypothetical protein
MIKRKIWILEKFLDIDTFYPGGGNETSVRVNLFFHNVIVFFMLRKLIHGPHPQAAGSLRHAFQNRN